MPDSKRLFIALDIPDAAQEMIKNIGDVLRKSGVRAKWVEQKNIHMTLKFLGDTDPSMIPPITDLLDKMLEGFPPLKLSIFKAGAFPDTSRPSVLWAGVSGDIEVAMKLARSIDRTLFEILEIPRETKSFKPHITFARIKKGFYSKNLAEALDRISEEESLGFISDSVTLYQSTLTKEGPIYRIIRKFDLA